MLLATEEAQLVEGLQWGRRCSAAEMRAAACRTEFARAASMGPPLFSGGNAVQFSASRLGALLQWGRRCSAAEMPVRRSTIPAWSVLQWGRRCSAAEIRIAWRISQQAWWLQWGRRCSAAEMWSVWLA